MAFNHTYQATRNSPLVVPAAQGVLADVYDPGQETLQAILDQPAANGVVALNSSGSFTYTPNTDFLGTDSFTFHAYDGLDNSNVATVTLVITQGLPPIVTNPGDQLITEGQAASLQIQAVDPESTHLTYSASGLPPGLSIDAVSGLITGTAGSTFNQHGPYTVTVTATDLAFNSGSTVFAWTVQNIPPTVIDHYYVTPNQGLQAPNAAFGVLVGSSDPGAETIQAILDQVPRMERSFCARRLLHLHPRHRLHRARQLHLSRL